ncbi:DVU_1556 family methyltransferase [Desulfotomaculum copahuensis]|uniref:Methyltransferase n=1 Tax=Desulfotomaculum copahuensis TaxID=1838280 RepID=A0A1B7LHK4_9FIRM|nr:class I SAM-dependent methyltransferase [Desulfotomaculum copahuensis]OAT85772.1 methyltransferase [Desulfotomaculum copahuensis]
MHSAGRCRVYESDGLRRVTGDSIRPGGFTLTGRALALCSFPPGARVLDVGCGAGATVEHLITNHNLVATGVDPSPVLLERGRQRRPDLPLREASGENLPFADGEMDGIFAECTLSVMENPDRALVEFCRVLKVGGRLVVTDVYARCPDFVPALRRLPLTSCLTGAMSRRELNDKIKSAGFETILWEDHSKLLAELTARLILTHGSLDAFWGKFACGPVSCREIKETVKKSRPGYFLLVAGKNG